MRTLVIALLAAGGAQDFCAATSRKALLIGIDRYDLTANPVRSVRPLQGAVSDARAMARLLEKQQFEVRLLLDRDATRDGILTAVRAFAGDARPGDIRVLYYSGHGAQVRNDASDEPDKLDETIVPIDAPAGALDVRDKELARELNVAIDRGAVLTVILDSCHSGSAVRGRVETVPQSQPKLAPMDLRVISDPSRPPAPELRGALVLSAAQDNEAALELRTPEPHGAFTTALIEVLSSEGAATEPARRIFLRTKQLMKKHTPQTPVLAGSLQRQRSSLFAGAPASIKAKSVVPVRVDGGKLVVDVGSALGLGIGSILARKTDGTIQTSLEITSVEGPSRATARLLEGEPVTEPALFEVLEWSPTPGTNLNID